MSYLIYEYFTVKLVNIVEFPESHWMGKTFRFLRAKQTRRSQGAEGAGALTALTALVVVEEEAGALPC